MKGYWEIELISKKKVYFNIRRFKYLGNSQKLFLKPIAEKLCLIL